MQLVGDLLYVVRPANQTSMLDGQVRHTPSDLARCEISCPRPGGDLELLRLVN
jgi:hypothetical protein